MLTSNSKMPFGESSLDLFAIIYVNNEVYFPLNGEKSLPHLPE